MDLPDRDLGAFVIGIDDDIGFGVNGFAFNDQLLQGGPRVFVFQ